MHSHSSPFPGQSISSWTDFEYAISFLFKNELRISVSAQPLLLILPITLRPDSILRMVALFFEKFHVPALAIVASEMVALLATGRTAGLILDIGRTHATSVVIYDASALRSSLQWSTLAGDMLTDLTRTTTAHCGAGWLSTGENDVAIRGYCQAMKEQVSFVASRGFDQMSATDWLSALPHGTTSLRRHAQYPRMPQLSADSYLALLPPDVQSLLESFRWTATLTEGLLYKIDDYNVIRMQREWACIPERLFSPPVYTGDTVLAPNVVELVANTLESISDPDLLLEIKDVVLSGGTTCLYGFAERLDHELKLRFPNRLKVVATEERRELAWLGGSILASLSVFPSLCTTSEECKCKAGALAVLRKSLW